MKDQVKENRKMKIRRPDDIAMMSLLTVCFLMAGDLMLHRVSMIMPMENWKEKNVN